MLVQHVRARDCHTAGRHVRRQLSLKAFSLWLPARLVGLTPFFEVVISHPTNQSDAV